MLLCRERYDELKHKPTSSFLLHGPEILKCLSSKPVSHWRQSLFRSVAFVFCSSGESLSPSLPLSIPFSMLHWVWQNLRSINFKLISSIRVSTLNPVPLSSQFPRNLLSLFQPLQHPLAHEMPPPVNTLPSGSATFIFVLYIFSLWAPVDAYSTMWNMVLS